MLIIIFLFLILLFIIPIRRIWNSFQHEGEITSNLLMIKKWEGISISASYFMFWIGLLINAIDIPAGEPLYRYEYQRMLESYTSLSPNHILIVIILFILGGFSYRELSANIENLSPILYVICSSFMIVNILFTAVYITHTGIMFYDEVIYFRYMSVFCIQTGALSLSLLFISKLKDSLSYFIQCQKKRDYKKKNKFCILLYRLSFRYEKMSRIWLISLFPLLLIVQIILVLY